MHVSEDSVATNYNSAGTTIMELIYGDNYLSPGGESASAALASFGQIAPGEQVLDAGSGLGGAAFYLAKQLGCVVCGIDVLAENVTSASERAQANGIADKVSFVCGDATTLPFTDHSYSVVWGQDAWCHIEDKSTLVQEFSRVLKKDGKLVFSDWLLGRPADSRNEAIRRITASPFMAEMQGYEDYLGRHGFKLTDHADGSAAFVERYRAILTRLRALEASLCERFPTRVYEKVLSKQTAVFEGFECGDLRFGSFVARRV